MTQTIALLVGILFAAVASGRMPEAPRTRMNPIRDGEMPPPAPLPERDPARRRNLKEFARSGRVLEVGRSNTMATKPASGGRHGGRHGGSAQGENEDEIDLDDRHPDDPGQWGGEQRGPEDPKGQYDPELTKFGSVKSSGCEKDTHTCNSCLDVGVGAMHVMPGQSMCVWCASSGSCVERSNVWDLQRREKIKNGEPPAVGTCRAGIASLPRHCGAVIDKIRGLFESKNNPSAVAAEEKLAEEMHFKIKMGWPADGDWVGHSEPADIALDGFYRAEEGKPTLVDICYSLFGPSSGTKPLTKICRNIRNLGENPLADLEFPEPGAYLLNAWAIDNVDDKFLSPMVSVAFDRLPSELFEEGVYSTRPHGPGFPNELEDTGLSSLMLASNVKLFNASSDGTPAKYRPSGFEAGGSLQSTTTLNIHNVWWDGIGDMKQIQKAASQGLGKIDRKFKHVTSWSHSFNQYHSSNKWTYRVWDRVSMEKMFEHEFNGIFYGLWLRLEHSQMDRINLSKYMILLLHGGVVTGPTMECFKPLDALVIQTGIVLAYEKKEKDMKISTDFMSSPPWHPFWWVVLHEIKRRIHVGEQTKIKFMKEEARRKTSQEEEEEAMKKDKEEQEGHEGHVKEEEPHVDMTGSDMLTEVFKTYENLYPDSSFSLMNEEDDVRHGDDVQRVILMQDTGKKKTHLMYVLLSFL